MRVIAKPAGETKKGDKDNDQGKGKTPDGVWIVNSKYLPNMEIQISQKPANTFKMPQLSCLSFFLLE